MKNIFAKVWLAVMALYVVLAGINIVRMVSAFANTEIELTVANYIKYAAMMTEPGFAGIIVFGGIFLIVGTYFIVND